MNVPEETNADEHRVEQRYPGQKHILLMPWGGNGEYESRRVRLLDCSAHGLGLEDSTPLEPGSQFAVYLQLTEVTMVLYTVRYCVPQKDGNFKVGACLDGFIGSPRQDADKVLASLLEERLV